MDTKGFSQIKTKLPSGHLNSCSQGAAGEQSYGLRAVISEKGGLFDTMFQGRLRRELEKIHPGLLVSLLSFDEP